MIMSRLGRLWTDAVAYVALTIGAGLSIAGNVADTCRTRGHAVDTLDIVMAVSWPALVILMVEIFVSTRWTGLGWPMQALRWTGTLAIGGMAMRVSWVHLNDLMASRGQKADVAILGPLAIDALAIMATALILAGRRTVSSEPAFSDERPVRVVGEDGRWTGVLDRAAQAPVPGTEDWTDHGPDGPWARQMADALAKSQALANTYATVGDEAESYLERLANHPDLDGTTTPAVPVVSGTLPQRKRPVTMTPEMDEEACWYAQVGRENGVSAGDISELLGGLYGVSGRTIRRRPWWTTVTRVN